MRPVDLEWHLSTLHVLSTHLEMKPPPPAFKLQNANTGRRVVSGTSPPPTHARAPTWLCRPFAAAAATARS
jgi:hypothetical protein